MKKGDNMKGILLCLFFTSCLMGYSFFTNEKSIQKDHLKLIHNVKDIIINTQKTRGLTNNYMNGNVVAQLLVYGQREQMSQNFSRLNKNFKPLELSPVYYKEASALMLGSKHLNKRAFKSPSAEVFSSYSGIIESWMDLNDKLITQGFEKADAKVYEDLKFLNNVLLPLTENIGKMRGMGSGIVARTYCKEDEAKKMKGFVREIKRFSMLLEYHLSGKSYSSLGSKEMIRINQNIQDYAELTSDKVISKKDIQLVTNAYFDEGTRAISEVIKIYNVIASSLNK